ncbi:MAG: carboxymuconolactone decarboxylase family protein [Candidatus Helarchaeota archaeon]
MTEEKILKQKIRDLENHVDDILSRLEKLYGSVPYIYRVLKEHPERIVGLFVKNNSVMRSRKSTIPPKMKELIALSAAVSQKCTHCIKVHVEDALALGATNDEILETILISSMIAESSDLAIALRSMDEVIKKERD